MYPGSYYSHTNPMPYYNYYAPNDNDPKLKDPQSHMKMDHNHIPLNSPYQPWSYAPNYPAPLDYHGCCNHSYFYGGPYGFRPPCPNYQLPPPPPPSLHSHGFYPFPGVYSIPPPHYSVEQPKYDYDKNKHSHHHCCGCKHQENEKKPNFEREAQEVDKKTSESLVPYFFKDCPYPIMGVPPGYMNTGSKATEKDKYSHEPVSLKTIEPAKRAENREIGRDQRSGDGRFRFPLFWLPSEKQEVGNDVKEKNVDLIARNGSTDETKKQTRINDETESDKSGKHVVQKVIPVKQVGADEETKIPKRIETKEKSDSVESKECKTSPKSSKLPPVCLRIDPLPRKKKTSQSPSPSGDKERSKGSSVNDLKTSQPMPDESNKNLKDQNNIKTIEVTNTANEVEKHSFSDHVSTTKGDESQKEGIQGQSSEVKESKNLSEYEAALIIQSAYRGFEVRKSQPLMKLKQISEVKKQVVDLRNRIQDLESSRVDEKQKLVIGETIMSILLKLDTIQGLHPIVRDVRKSVAKEVVSLQEKLDSQTSVKPEAPIDENLSSVEQVVHTKDDCIQEKSDQGQSQSNNDVKVMILCENHQVEVTGHDGAETCDTNLEQPQLELCNEEEIEQPAVQENLDQALNQYDSINGVGLTDFVDNTGGVGGHDITLVEQNKCEQLQMFEEPQQPVETVLESRSDICVDFRDDVGTELEPLVELESQPSFLEVSKSQLGNLEDELQVNQDKLDHTDGRFKADVGNVDSCAIETMESRDIDSDRDAAAKSGIPEDFIVSTEEAPKADDVDSCTEIVTDDLVRVMRGDNKRLTEENEKLRVAMEELMKTGNEQLNVIKELTGRVKDLEKKLSTNKKKIKVNNRFRGRRVFQEELNV